MRYFIAATQFITILSLGKDGTYDPPKMIPYFPSVGLLLGILLALFDHVVLQVWSPPVASLLDVIFLAVLTGAFHIDGLGDTADGLYGQRPKEKALAIMKDSRLGTMGLVAILFGLSTKWAGISGLAANRGLLLIIIPAYARSAMLFGIRFFDYGRPGGGTGSDFFKEKLKLSGFWGMIIPVVLSGLLGWKAIGLNVGFAVITAMILWFYNKRMGCITGDMLGAMTEITESALFLLISIGGVV
jgi:adenosylcobinamide-GDP ribazoletransferase